MELRLPEGERGLEYLEDWDSSLPWTGQLQEKIHSQFLVFDCFFGAWHTKLTLKYHLAPYRFCSTEFIRSNTSIYKLMEPNKME